MRDQSDRERERGTEANKKRHERKEANRISSTIFVFKLKERQTGFFSKPLVCLCQLGPFHCLVKAERNIITQYVFGTKKGETDGYLPLCLVCLLVFDFAVCRHAINKGLPTLGSVCSQKKNRFFLFSSLMKGG